MCQRPKLAIVLSSPNGINGCTACLVKAFAAGARESGADIEIFPFDRCHIRPCQDCRACARTGRCPLDDDFEKIEQAFLHADGIVLATPNYMFNISAQMKALLDRCHNLYHCQALSGTYSAVLMTSGGPYTGTGEEYLVSTLRRMGCRNVGSVMGVKAVMTRDAERRNVLNEAAELGRCMIRAIHSGDLFPDGEQERLEHFELMKSLCLMFKDELPYVYTYWKERWGLEDSDDLADCD